MTHLLSHLLVLADAPPCAQFHFHTPSEHTINGAHYPLEMHMVHKLFRTNTSTALAPVRTAGNTPGATLQRAAVIGIMFAYECVPAPARAPCRCLSDACVPR